MNLRRQLGRSALLGLLIVSCSSGIAEENGNVWLNSALSGTTVSGYVDTSANWSSAPAAPHQCHCWWHKLLHHLGQRAR